MWKIYYRFKEDIHSLYVYRRKKFYLRGNGFAAVLYDILGSHCNEYECYRNLVCDAEWCFGTAFFCSADDGSRGFLRNVGVFVPDYMCHVPADSIARKVDSGSMVNVDSVDIATV
jgi:hypothetical protein